MKPAEPGPTSNLALTDTGNWAQTLCSQAHPAPSLPLQTHRQTDRHSPCASMETTASGRTSSCRILTAGPFISFVRPSALHTQHLSGKIAARTTRRTRPGLAGEELTRRARCWSEGAAQTPGLVSPPCLPHAALDPHVLLQERHRVMK